MKGSARDLDAIVKRGGFAAILLYGGEPLRIFAKRKAALDTLLGEKAEEDMRLTRMHAADLRKDPASLIDAIKAVGFFPGARGVLVEDAGDGLAQPLLAALEDWVEGDAVIIITAGQLNKGSKLRKGFEAAKNAHALGVYNDPPTRAEVEAALAKAGLKNVSPDAASALADIARITEPGDFAQMLDKLSLYCLNEQVSVEDVRECAPAVTEGALDDTIHAVAEGQVTQIGPQLQRLVGQGMTATTICIATARHFRQLHAVASHEGGADAGFQRMRPPIFGPRRDRMARQVRGWGSMRLEDALGVLVETDLDLRSTKELPQMALLERKLMRISLMCPK